MRHVHRDFGWTDRIELYEFHTTCTAACMLVYLCVSVKVCVCMCVCTNVYVRARASLCVSKDECVCVAVCDVDGVCFLHSTVMCCKSLERILCAAQSAVIKF